MMLPVNEFVALASLVLGGGVIGTIIASFNSKKVGMKGHENEARRDIDNAWDKIATSFQNQLVSLKSDFEAQKADLNTTKADLSTTRSDLLDTQKELRHTQRELTTTSQLLTARERVNLILLAHMIELEKMIPTPPGPLPRPMELAEILKEKIENGSSG